MQRSASGIGGVTVGAAECKPRARAPGSRSYIPAMAIHPLIERHRDELDKCVTCAVCQSVCPTFQMTGREKLSPRGRIIMLRRMAEGDLDPRQIDDDAFDYCTLCYACQTACPAGVKTDILFIAARQQIAASKGLPKAKQKIFETLEKPDRVENRVKLGSFAQKTLGRGLVNRMAGGMEVPPLRDGALLKVLPERIEAEGRTRARVGFFAGCMSNYVDATAALACLEVLRRAGAEIVIPRDQGCCGAPAFNNGDMDTAVRLAARNIGLFREADVDALISPDATCGGAFRHEIPELVQDDLDLAVDAQEIREKTLDWATFLVTRLDPRYPDTRQPPVTVTVHDSCHLTHTARTHGNVRLLLRRLPGVEIVEMAESTICCGFGGSFSAVYPDDARRWARRKLGHIGTTEADIAVVSSPGCLQHLAASRENGQGPRLMHPAELICERMGWNPVDLLQEG